MVSNRSTQAVRAAEPAFGGSARSLGNESGLYASRLADKASWNPSTLSDSHHLASVLLAALQLAALGPNLDTLPAQFDPMYSQRENAIYRTY